MPVRDREGELGDEPAPARSMMKALSMAGESSWIDFTPIRRR
jgi:hypothetical protein